MNENDETGLDDTLAALGISAETPTRADELYLIMTEGKFKKIDNCKYWLTHEMAKFGFLNSKTVRTGREVFNDGKVIIKSLTKVEYAKLMLEYYLNMYHLPYFQDLPGRPAADMGKFVDLLMTYEPIKKAVEKDY